VTALRTWGRGASFVLGEALLLLIALYRLLLAPLLGGRCRFTPSCSRYAADCVELHGPFRGGWLALVRLSKCHPFHPGGHDPPIREC
jgi:uncharacterized protein